jgi:hypothetical protein
MELTWIGDSVNSRDPDAHFIHPGGTLNSYSDCYYSNKTPTWTNWGSPRLNLDDQVGPGPEITTLNNPSPGTYSYKVYYYSDHGHGATTATAKIWINGVLRDTRALSITHHQLWHVWDIAWSGSDATVTFVNDATEPPAGEIQHDKPLE